MSNEHHRTRTPDTVSDEWARTLRVTVAGTSPDDNREPDSPTIEMRDTDHALSVFNASTLELLAAIRAHSPESIAEAARITGRKKSNVHPQLQRMAAFGVVEFEDHGTAKRPIVVYDEIKFDFAVSLDEEASEESASTVA